MFKNQQLLKSNFYYENSYIILLFNSKFIDID